MRKRKHESKAEGERGGREKPACQFCTSSPFCSSDCVSLAVCVSLSSPSSLIVSGRYAKTKPPTAHWLWTRVPWLCAGCATVLSGCRHRRKSPLCPHAPVTTATPRLPPPPPFLLSTLPEKESLNLMSSVPEIYTGRASCT